MINEIKKKMCLVIFIYYHCNNFYKYIYLLSYSLPNTAIKVMKVTKNASAIEAAC